MGSTVLIKELIMGEKELAMRVTVVGWLGVPVMVITISDGVVLTTIIGVG